ncbi:conserved Plasmodium protein, unknown function [Plasmodium malariae]|uniref:Uncharacterized protein n=1 Tax=Plasmodium malariae TaxID=5858 RepID=A0A1C3KBX5_PLAMA|nr:conserved Plasmodium protein, unknown function [Plasmodium malariae]SBT71070.1 conserved Plasmodium protein, unknown function [Plasmodium malariae]
MEHLKEIMNEYEKIKVRLKKSKYEYMGKIGADVPNGKFYAEKNVFHNLFKVIDSYYCLLLFFGKRRKNKNKKKKKSNRNRNRNRSRRSGRKSSSRGRSTRRSRNRSKYSYSDRSTRTSRNILVGVDINSDADDTTSNDAANGSRFHPRSCIRDDDIVKQKEERKRKRMNSYRTDEESIVRKLERKKVLQNRHIKKIKHFVKMNKTINKFKNYIEKTYMKRVRYNEEKRENKKEKNVYLQTPAHTRRIRINTEQNVYFDKFVLSVINFLHSLVEAGGKHDMRDNNIDYTANFECANNFTNQSNGISSVRSHSNGHGEGGPQVEPLKREERVDIHNEDIKLKMNKKNWNNSQKCDFFYSNGNSLKNEKDDNYIFREKKKKNEKKKFLFFLEIYKKNMHHISSSNSDVFYYYPSFIIRKIDENLLYLIDSDMNLIKIMFYFNVIHLFVFYLYIINCSNDYLLVYIYIFLSIAGNFKTNFKLSSRIIEQNKNILTVFYVFASILKSNILGSGDHPLYVDAPQEENYMRTTTKNGSKTNSSLYRKVSEIGSCYFLGDLDKFYVSKIRGDLKEEMNMRRGERKHGITSRTHIISTCSSSSSSSGSDKGRSCSPPQAHNQNNEGITTKKTRLFPNREGSKKREGVDVEEVYNEGEKKNVPCEKLRRNIPYNLKRLNITRERGESSKSRNVEFTHIKENFTQYKHLLNYFSSNKVNDNSREEEERKNIRKKYYWYYTLINSENEVDSVNLALNLSTTNHNNLSFYKSYIKEHIYNLFLNKYNLKIPKNENPPNESEKKEQTNSLSILGNYKKLFSHFFS